MTSKANNKSKKDDEDFPFTSPYDELLMGKTLTKRGAWWTAVLLVKPKEKNEENFSEPNQQKPKSVIKPKIMIQRWQKIKRASDESGDEGSQYWRRKKDFTLSKRVHWEKLKEIIDTWIEEELWIE